MGCGGVRYGSSVTGTLGSRLARLTRLAAGTLIASAALIGVSASPAHAVDAVASYTVAGSLGADGVLDVKATLQLEGSPQQVQQRFATTLNSGRDQQYRFALTGVGASVGGKVVTPNVASEGDYTVVTVPVAGASGPVEISYQVSGAAMPAGKSSSGTDLTEVNWRLLQGLNLPVKVFDATITVPGIATSVNCYAGPPATPGACGFFGAGTHDTPDPTFHAEGLGAGEVVGAVLRFPSSAVKPNADLRKIWTLDGAFSAAPLPLLVALGAGLLGGLAYWLAYRRFGRDAEASVAPTVLASFKPVGDGQSEFSVVGALTPGEVGTLADEHVDPVDVTASVVDLAVRGHLVITQLPRGGEFRPTEWTLSRGSASSVVSPYEQAILDALAGPGSGPMLLSDAAPALASALPAIQAGLYDEVVRKGWFVARPDRTRGRWSRLGWIALVVAAIVAVALIALTSFGLLALVLVALAAGVGMLGQIMPARTAAGSSALAGLGMLRGLLLTQPTDQAPRGREHEQLASVLPYAIVLGGADRWLDSLASVNDQAKPDETELSWYHGPSGWTLADLPDSLRNFVRAFNGTLVSR